MKEHTSKSMEDTPNFPGELGFIKKESNRMHNQTDISWKFNIINNTTRKKCGKIAHTQGIIAKRISKVHPDRQMHIVRKMPLPAT